MTAHLHRLGVAPAPLTGRLTAERLAAAVESALTLTPAARTLAGHLSAEDGVATAVARITEQG